MQDWGYRSRTSAMVSSWANWRMMDELGHNSVSETRKFLFAYCAFMHRYGRKQLYFWEMYVEICSIPDVQCQIDV
jgi:hypothetical protein